MVSPDAYVSADDDFGVRYSPAVNWFGVDSSCQIDTGGGSSDGYSEVHSTV